MEPYSALWMKELSLGKREEPGTFQGFLPQATTCSEAWTLCCSSTVSSVRMSGPKASCGVYRIS